jgi:hypothetical protein
MKKTYEKPTLVRRETLSLVTAQNFSDLKVPD